AADLDRALAAVREVVRASPRVLKDPAPVTAVETVAETITIVAKAWLAISDWEPAQAELYPSIVELRRAQIPPFGAPAQAAERLGGRGHEPQARRLAEVDGARLRARQPARLGEERVDRLFGNRARARHVDLAAGAGLGARVVALELRAASAQPLEGRAAPVGELVERHDLCDAGREWPAAGEQALVARAHLHRPEVRGVLVPPELTPQPVHNRRSRGE